MNQGVQYPIKLDALMFVKTSVISVPHHKPAEKALEFKPENSLNVAPVEGSPNHFNAAMKTTMNLAMDPACPYAIDMECIGVLSTNGTLSAEDELRGVKINAHSTLYGAIRESVAWITGRHPYGPLLLGLSLLQQQEPSKASE